MSLLNTLRTDPDEWNRPRRMRVWGPVAAGLGGAAGAVAGQTVLSGAVDPAIAGGIAAGGAALLAMVAAAALD